MSTRSRHKPWFGQRRRDDIDRTDEMALYGAERDVKFVGKFDDTYVYRGAWYAVPLREYEYWQSVLG